MKVNLTIHCIISDKKRYLPLLLLGDESEKMIDRYLNRGTLYVGFILDIPISVCVTTLEDNGDVEIKNLAVLQEYRRKGIGRIMLEHVEKVNSGRSLILGTGETPSTLRFYRSCGYSFSHVVTNFFKDNYDTPIIEEGVLLRDMIYLRKG